MDRSSGRHVRDVVIAQRRQVHSGKDFTANAVVQNFEKAADPDRGFDNRPLVANVEKVTAVDLYTGMVRFKSITADMFDIFESLLIVDPAAMTGLRQRGAGTGPFKFVEWIPGDHATFERNPDYWRKPLPYVDRVTVKSYRDTDAMVAALQSGLVDAAVLVPPKDIGGLSHDFAVIRALPAITYDLRINVKKPPLDKVEVRQAPIYSIDRQGIVDKVLFGLSQPTVLPWSPNPPAYDRALLTRCSYNLSKAKALLAKTGEQTWKAQLIASSQTPERVAMAQVLQADLAKIGFTLDVAVVDQTEFNRRITSGDFQLLIGASGSANQYPTQIQIGRSMYRISNNPVWGNDVPKPYVDAMNAARATLDPAKQRQAFRQIAATLLDQVWVLPIAY